MCTCVLCSWRSVRIDGGTSVDERQSIVDNFNTRGIGQVFLLSTRAGGAGLNLIGANHLVGTLPHFTLAVGHEPWPHL